MSAPQEMIEAVQAGDVARVASLLAADPALAGARAPNGDSAVLLAAYHGRREIAEMLVDAGAPLDIFEAAAVGRAGRVAELLRQRPELAGAYSHDGWTALHLAAFFGHVAAAEALLAAGADICAVSNNSSRNQPLNAAAAGDHLDVVNLLIVAGADVNARDGSGFTPLHAAAQNGNTAIVRALLNAGADPQAQQGAGRTPLALALEAGKQGAADLLRSSR
ncbi:MAG: ankyrin repeat domain-containing protein [Chloroflexota bacterium]